MTKPKPNIKTEIIKNLAALKDCAAKRKRIECAKENKLQIFVLAARATSNER